MHRLIPFLFWLLLACPVFAQSTYTWTAGTNTNFQLPANWNPARTTPAPDDILVFNNVSPAVGAVNNIPTQTIGQLFIQDNRSMTFSAPTGSSTLTLSGGTGTDFLVESGCSMVFDGNNTNSLIITFNPGVTGLINGSLTFTNSGGGTDPDHQLLLPDATSSLTFSNGSVFSAAVLNGSPFGNSGAANVITFQAGAVYISGAGANPFGLTQPASKVVFQTGSLYRHQQSTQPGLSGRTYADFDFNYPGTVFVGLGGNTGCTIDNLSVLQGTVNITLSTNKLPANLKIKRNLTVAPGAVFNYSPADPAAASVFSLEGITTQTLTNNGVLTFGTNSNFALNNTNIGSNDLVLNNNLTLDGSLLLTLGIVNTGVNVLSLGATATDAVSAGSDNSHVNGNLKRVVLAGSFYHFPVGDGQAKQTITLNTDCPGNYTARFYNSTPATSPLIAFTEAGYTFSELLTKGYWNMTSDCPGTPTYELRLSPRDFPDFPAGKAAYTFAKRSNPAANWLLNGTFSNPGGSASGIQPDLSLHRTGLVNFSDFAVVAGSVPLPVTYLSFSAKAEAETNLLEWKTAREENNAGFEIERAADGSTFEKIGFVPAGMETNAYYFRDIRPLQSNYYRIKQVDVNGNFSYSKSLFVSGTSQTALIRVFPNPTDGAVTISLAGESVATLVCYNTQGQLLLKSSGTPAQLSRYLSLALQQAASGLYYLLLNQSERAFKTTLVKF